uniref:Uncharacterized protein n=1 Tax=Anguilla anguilla TaxID=7936 RepID=A0A0E9RMJ3_ANGAN
MHFRAGCASICIHKIASSHIVAHTGITGIVSKRSYPEQLTQLFA